MLDVLAKAAALRASPLFASLDAESLLPIAERAGPARLADGERLFAIGDEGEAAYVLVAGRLRAERAGGAVEELGPGDVVGEMAGVDGGPRTSTVTALGEAELLRFEPDHFLDLLVDHPPAARALAVMLAARLR